MRHSRKNRKNFSMLRKINLSAAIIVLICFFLPWEQVSCGGAKDTLTGLDLARDIHGILWLVPALMMIIILLGLLRSWKDRMQTFAIVSLICGAISAALMNRERLRVHDESGVISAQLTGWFWLAFISVFALVISAIGMLLRRQRSQ